MTIKVPTSIGPHALPKALLDLLESGRWHVEQEALTNVLRRSGGPAFESAPYCLDADEIEGQLWVFQGLGRFPRPPPPGISVWDAYGFRSSAQERTPVQLPWLDIDNALPIILSSEDGPEIWLDYRVRPESPRIVAPVGIATAERARDFVVIAISFQEFLTQLRGVAH
ncbi:MAG: hypothetical protein H6738_15125 [Alphaproteobacteria bacterium]|nr:hypothetical protein [Alphaproteobacteria bacterium]MCB9698110.1 hypothetical protein [Alphaproteobacteria bacterium]